MITVYGSNVKNVDQLKGINMERPKRAGAYWQGIPHHDLTSALIDEVNSRGWKITEQAYAVSKDKADLAGAFTLEVKGLEAPEGQSLSLGFLTSNAMRRSLKMVVGTKVACCNNGMATGEIVLHKKHTSGFNLFKEIEEACDAYLIKAATIADTVKSLREQEIGEDDVDSILMEAGRSKLMPWSRIGAVDAEYRKPTYAEHGTGTSWALLNAFTHTVKRNPPQQQMEQMNRFRAMLPTTELALAS